ncbi:capsular biosynthesis protein, partial [Vibrio parahaemolyticus]|nr:capsular biosynthesis protein [Vibrio parahaemolyticus]
MFLIMSASFVDQELQSEFGKIPPSFLPLGNKRLFQHQLKLAPKNSIVYLSLPESFFISNTDEKWLINQGVRILKIPENLSLGASLVASLNLSEHNLDSPFSVLFGDTLFNELPVGENIICVSESSNSYNWAVVTDNEMHWLTDSENKIDSNVRNIVNGYFRFSSPRNIIRSITRSNWEFLDGLNEYHKIIGLTAVYSKQWLDFGHVNTYYNSKAHFTTQRAFNELRITSDYVEKSSFKSNKIAAEANWFSTLPYSLRNYIPQYLGSEKNNEKIRYKLEYLYLTALNELYVFSSLPVNTWEQILRQCIAFIKDCQQEKAPNDCNSNRLVELFGDKTQVRLNDYCNSQNISMSTQWIFNGEEKVSLEGILTETERYLPKSDEKKWPLCVLHGDFCFSNVLYDFRSNRVKTIDPRGMTLTGEQTIYGDIRYDIAKLSHSIIGMYDWIIAGYYEVDIKGNNINFTIDESHIQKTIQQKFIEMVKVEFDLEASELIAMQIQLFLSMLPLHHDDINRQKALFANAFKLYFL